jgi:YHS domain-containing protein
MRRFAVLLLILVSCRKAAPGKPHAAAGTTDVRTIENTSTPPAPVQPPPVLADEAAAPNPISTTSTANPVVLTPADVRLRASLPFAPAIALDPVDGAKLSIRATTPTSSYKGRTFYFTSEANKHTFDSNPEQYEKGRFAHL